MNAKPAHALFGAALILYLVWVAALATLVAATRLGPDRGQAAARARQGSLAPLSGASGKLSQSRVERRPGFAWIQVP
jgi:hypothetical protein